MINIIKTEIEYYTNLLKNTKTKKEKIYIHQKLTSLNSQLEREQIEQTKKTKKELLEKLGKLKDLRRKAEVENDLREYEKVSKQIKLVQKEINERKVNINYLTMAQIKNILKAIKKHSKTPLRDELMILLGLSLGLRVSELIQLKFSDVDDSEMAVYCNRKKNSISNKIPITPSLWKKIKLYKEESNKLFNDFIFSSSKSTTITPQGVNGILKKYGELAKIPKEFLHYHILKHTAGVFLAESGYTTSEIKYILGHKEVKSTQIYVGFSKGQYETIENKLRNDLDIF